MSASLRRALPVTAVVVAGLLGTGLASTANAAATTITGTVKTAGGTGVAGASVVVKVGGQNKSATTNASGQFSLNVQTGSATVDVAGGPADAALPQVWEVKGISTTIDASDVLNINLPATSVVSLRATQGGVAVPGAAITQCRASTSQADAAVVLAGSPAVAPTQDFTGATTNATGDVVVQSFKDATLGRLCARYSTTTAGTVTTYAARSGVFDATNDVFKTIFVPVVTEQAGNVKDSTGGGQAALKVSIRSAGGRVDSTSPLTTASGAFSTEVSGSDVFARISGSSLSSAVAPPNNIPRAFKATFDATASASPWTVSLPATVTLTVKVENADGSPVTGAIIRPAGGSSFGVANEATLVAGASPATLTQQIYGDGKSDATGLTSARLFPDSSLGAFRVLKNAGGGLKREVVVPAGTILNGAKQITVVLPPAA
jgi:hypothetical protein